MNGTKKNLPKHVAIIMDGNGRWAQAQDLPRLEGHRKGVEVVEKITEHACDLGIKNLTLYAFSKENWQRPAEEVRTLMQLLAEFLKSKTQKMLNNGIALNTIGDLSLLPKPVLKILEETCEATKGGRKMVLTLALSYGSRDEILRAIKKLMTHFEKNRFDPDDLTPEHFAEYLDTSSLPDPDLVIRTSGESRISNFLLWQSAYAEFKFVDENWPEFTTKIFDNCLLDYQNRERRFGKTSEQLK